MYTITINSSPSYRCNYFESLKEKDVLKIIYLFSDLGLRFHSTNPLQDHLFKIALIKSRIRKSFSKDENLQTIKKSKKIFDKAFHPLTDFYKIYIDYAVHTKKDPMIFDKEEPGYSLGMERAFEYLRHTLLNPINADELIKLHDLCITGVFHEQVKQGKYYKLQNQNGIFQKGLSTTNCAFPLLKINPEALKELYEEKTLFVDEYFKTQAICKPQVFLSQLKIAGKIQLVQSLGITDEKQIQQDHTAIKKKINEIFQKYNEEIKEISTYTDKNKLDSLKLRSIAKCCRKLEVFHIFPDGNQRTIVFVLLNKLLLQNDFSPCILEEPYVFDGENTLDELEKLIKKGINIFQEACNKSPVYKL